MSDGAQYQADQLAHRSWQLTYPHGEAKVTALPGHGAIAVFHDARVAWDRQRKGLGTAYHASRLAFAREQDFVAAVCTVNCDNFQQIAILTKFGWIRGPRVECTMYHWEAFIYTKDLSRPDEPVTG